MKHLIIDVHNLCWRAHHTTGGLKNGVLFGFLREILALKRLHSPDRISFCFDSQSSKRKAIYPAYKKRPVPDETERAERQNTIYQIDDLRTSILPKLGYKNLFFQEGYEADDLIASVRNNISGNDEGIIVSSDQDLYQLLSDWKPRIIKIWDARTKSIFTASAFYEKYGIDMSKWAMVKAIGGCSSDNIRGVEGVGEKKAIQWLKGAMRPDSSTAKKIKSFDPCDMLMLTSIPYPGTMECITKKDQSTPAKWDSVLKDLGMKSLREFNYV